MNTKRAAYESFLRSKMPRPQSSGIAVDEACLPTKLFDFQKHCAIFALQQGCSGIYLDTGLGKSAIELAFAARATSETGKPSLILTPLAVASQMRREADRFDISAYIVREQKDVDGAICICNYDRLHKLDPDVFGAVVLDEASILKSFTGKTTHALMQAFARYRFKLCATATPAPNDHMELGQQAQFLSVMDSNEMLMRWFIADQTQMGRYRLKGHGERDFYDWMASWSRMAENPADLGFDGSRFVLPPLALLYHQAEASVIPPEFELFAQAASATAIHDIKRQTVTARAELAGSLCTEPCVLWCDTNYEADALRKVLPQAIEVRGSQPIEKKEELLEAFASGQAPILISKPSICGFGLNWQHIRRMVFVGRSFSYENYYQAIRRCWRFGQTRDVEAHIIIAEGETQTSEVINRKSDDHVRMKQAMSAAMQRAIRKDATLQTYEPTLEGRLPEWLTESSIA